MVAGSQPELLAVDSLEVVYAGVVRALRGVTMSVRAGQVVAVLGGNGAGKSTLLRAVSGTLGMHGAKVTAGALRFDGQDLAGRGAADIVRLGLVHVPEGRRIFGRLTVEENLRAGGMSVRGRAARAQARDQVYELFPLLAERRHSRAVLLSGGEQQMLAIGRGLMSAPRMLLLDEPSLGLAPQIIGKIGAAIREINAQGVSVVLVEQNAAMALALSEVAFVLELGRTSLSGPSAELAASDEVARRYLAVAGEPAPGTEPPAPGDSASPASPGAEPPRPASPARTLSRWQPPPTRRVLSRPRARVGAAVDQGNAPAEESR
ncbi:ATP-binding cassette domain-containing protein [Pseudofrankia asymbiotica]|uniref:ATP-binding cassette domain-containing protein n=1 Tax=Pseudofrankia asymbiotica TaxID=1834516 RepID=UPI00097762F7|nr:ATP-binding cassette domain-containing protein [Pseudofrankia asymbiotica]